MTGRCRLAARVGAGKTGRALAVLLLSGFASCPSSGGGTGPLIVESATPTPEPLPTQIPGSARLIAMSVPPGSTLVAQPLNTRGQQVPELWATVGLTLNQDVPHLALLIYLRTPEARCLGGSSRGYAAVKANAETVIETLNVSNGGAGSPGMPAVCPLPFATTDAEILVSDPTGRQLFEAHFPVTYHFVAQ